MILFITLVVISISLYFTFTSPQLIIGTLMGIVGAFAIAGLVYLLINTYQLLSEFFYGRFGKDNVNLFLFFFGLLVCGFLVRHVLRRIESDSSDTPAAP